MLGVTWMQRVGCPHMADAVEKVGPSIGINALGIFDPAETGRRFGFTAA
jgi:hypothetical protein